MFQVVSVYTKRYPTIIIMGSMKANQKNVLDIAKAILCIAEQDAHPIDHLKLQKVLYFAQALSLVRNGEVLFNEKIEAWGHGPVIEEVYQAFKGYKDKGIVCEEEYKESLDKINKKERSVLEDILITLKRYNGADLRDITHSHKPWKEVYEKGKNHEITPEVVQSYYKGVFA